MNNKAYCRLTEAPNFSMSNRLPSAILVILWTVSLLGGGLLALMPLTASLCASTSGKILYC